MKQNQETQARCLAAASRGDTLHIPIGAHSLDILTLQPKTGWRMQYICAHQVQLCSFQSETSSSWNAFGLPACPLLKELKAARTMILSDIDMYMVALHWRISLAHQPECMAGVPQMRMAEELLMGPRLF
jgi:hypothetical protein